MARRAAGLLIAAAALLFVIVSFWGTANPGSLVPYSSASGGTWPVFTITRVTNAGYHAGLRPGDVLDYRRLTPLTRYWFDPWGSGPVIGSNAVTTGGHVAAYQRFNVPYFRDGHEIQIVQRTTTAAPLIDQAATIFTDILAGFCVAFGALLLIRGRDRRSFLGGLFLALLGAVGVPYVYGYNGFFAIAPIALPSEVCILVAESVALAALYLFAEGLLPPQTPPALRWVFRVLYAPGVIALCISNCYYGLRYFALGDVESLPTTVNLYSSLAWALSIVAVLALVWYASIDRHQTQRISVQVIFWSMLIGFSGVLANIAIAGFLGEQWLLDGALSLTLLAMPVGLAYVVFTKNLYDIDFFVSRAALYAVLLCIIVAVIALTESFVDHVALGRYGNIALSFAVPISLGLSMRWIGGRVERFLQSTLYRDKSAAHERLRALADDFAEAHDPDTLTRRVVAEIHRTFKSPCAVYRIDGAVYLPFASEGFEHPLAPIAQDDPAFMRLRRCRGTVDVRDFETALPRHGLLFPLSVVGRVYGAILVGARPHDQWYDPDDQSVIRGVAAELAAALLWLRDRSLAAPDFARDDS